MSLVAVDWVNVRELKAFRDGLIQPQDPTATAVVDAAAPRGGMSVLDFCAAPGTKTTQFGETMADAGRIVAVDVSPERLQKIEDNCRRLGVSIVTTCLAEKVGGLEVQSFDLALVDAPCSNTGVLARRPEARWRFSVETLHSLAADQRSLLSLASQFVRSGGKLVYSTCSIEPEENGEVVKWAVSKVPGLQLVREELTLPGGADDPRKWCDGGYFALFRVR
jgi:16S rRNA (cytosine967-C5)-methyltransferase